MTSASESDARAAELEQERAAKLADLKGAAAKSLGGKPRRRKAGGQPGGGWWQLIKMWQSTAVWSALSPRGCQVFVTVLGHCRRYRKGPKGKAVYRYSGNRARLADACGCSPGTITDALAELETRGMLKRSQRITRQAGGFVSCVHVWPCAPGTETESLPGMAGPAGKSEPTESQGD